MLLISYRRHHCAARLGRWALVSVCILSAVFAWSQTAVGTGSIVGVVTGPSGTAANSIKITIANMQTGHTIDLTPSVAGIFQSGALPPGKYKVQVASKSFRTVSQTFTVQMGNTAAMNVALEPGNENEIVEMASRAGTVNTEQPSVQGVLSTFPFDSLPVNGRNLFAYAQLEPWVQLEDGQNYGLSKAGYSYFSLAGRSGRKTRMTLDGIDLNDAVVGTTTQTIPVSAIEEVQIIQSLSDVSHGLASSGSINVITRSGTNAFHGEAFGLFTDHKFNARPAGGVDLPFQRSQYGGRVGGPIIKNKLYFFLDGERIKQDASAPVFFSDPFSILDGSSAQPFRQDNLLAKLDYNFENGVRVFYRFSYFAIPSPTMVGQGFSTIESRSYARNQEAGVDFRTGVYSHSIRASYLGFHNQLGSTVGGSNPISLASSDGFFAGSNPQELKNNLQSGYQIKYDGARTYRDHVLHFGGSYNRIQAARFANLYGNAPQIYWNTGVGAGDLTNPQTGSEVWFAQNSCGNNVPCFTGGINNYLNYPVENVLVGNGLGYSTAKSALGLPAGGAPADTQIGLYLGGNWKAWSNLTLNYGVRYERETGVINSDLAAISGLDTAFPGYGNRVRQPNLNFAPQLGIAWDPYGSGKTSIRAGIGLFYESAQIANTLADRQYRLPTGTFGHVSAACIAGIPQPVMTTTGVIRPDPGACAQSIPASPDPINGGSIPIGTAVPNILAFWQQVKNGNVQNFGAANPNYLSNSISEGLGVPLGVYAPNYRTPRSLQINFGIQHEFGRGTIFSVDYLRSVETHSLLAVDVNHVGDASDFSVTRDLPNALAAIHDTLAACGGGVTTINLAIASCPGLHPTGSPGATMADFAHHGLTSSAEFGGDCTGAIGHPCAFGGKNPNQGQAFFLSPVGRSLYSGLQIKLTKNVDHPLRGVQGLNFQLAYTRAHSKGSGNSQTLGTVAETGQDSILQAADNNNVNRYFGPTVFDRTNQFSFAAHADAPFGFHIGVMAHLYSPLSASLLAPASGTAGEIFRTDFTGDGTTQDPILGMHFGGLGGYSKASGLNTVISNYNHQAAGNVTPAGSVLIQNNLMTFAQLQALGGVAPLLSVGPANNARFNWLKEFDFKLAWRHTLRERFMLEPSVSFYNALNLSNFNVPPNMMSSLLTGAPGAINGTTTAGNQVFHAGNGTGVNSQGAPRQIEFGFRMTF